MSALTFGPASRDIAIPRGSTPRLRIRLTSRNVRTGALAGRPVAGDVVQWALLWPSETQIKTTAADGELTVDPVTRVVSYPMTEAQAATIPDAGLPFWIAIVNADGQRFRWLEGTIRLAGLK